MVHAPTPSPTPPERPEDLLLFTPVPTASRVTGWTSDKQIAFIESLRRTGVVAKAAWSVGMSASAAYQLRKRAGADSSFVWAWDAALKEAQDKAMESVCEQTFDARPEAVWHRGRQVGWKMCYNNRLLFAALRGMNRASGQFRPDMRALDNFLPGDATRNDVTPPRNEISERP